MSINESQGNQLSFRKHRTPKEAMLSALTIFFIILLAAGLTLSAKVILSRIPSPIPVPAANLAAAAPAALAPEEISIPAIGVNAPVSTLGLNADGSLQVPSNDTSVGWYTGSVAPGEIGPSVMVGHLDSEYAAAVFINLYKLQPGDLIHITRQDGSLVTFQVDSTQNFPQNNFPSGQVYGSIDYPGLRLITCSGTYSTLLGHYSENLVVYATLVPQ